MMKKTMAILLAVALLMAASLACAEGAAKLDAFADRLKNAAMKQAGVSQGGTEEAIPDTSFGPALLIDDPFYQKVRSSAYLQESKYSKEVNVMIELKNVSGRTLYPDDVSIQAVSASGAILDEETYANCGPTMVENGASLFIWDWFYDPKCELSEIDHFAVKIESDTSSYKTYATIDAQAMVIDGIAYALVENTKDSDIYGLDATIAVETADGRLLDVCKIDTGNSVGVFPQSTMVLRDNVEDYATDSYLTEGIATAYATYELD